MSFESESGFIFFLVLFFCVCVFLNRADGFLLCHAFWDGEVLGIHELNVFSAIWCFKITLIVLITARQNK